MRIREATPDDARAIAEVHVASWRWAYRELLPDDLLQKLSVDDREEMWRDGLSEPSSGRGCLVAEDGVGRLLGFAGFGPPEDTGEPDGTGELHAIYLEESVVGTGVGRELLARAAKALGDSGYRRAILWVLAKNDRARRFYEKAGWWWDGAESTHRIDCANEPVMRYVVEL